MDALALVDQHCARLSTIVIVEATFVSASGLCWVLWESPM